MQDLVRVDMFEALEELEREPFAYSGREDSRPRSEGLSVHVVLEVLVHVVEDEDQFGFAMH